MVTYASRATYFCKGSSYFVCSKQSSFSIYLFRCQEAAYFWSLLKKRNLVTRIHNDAALVRWDGPADEGEDNNCDNTSNHSNKNNNNNNSDINSILCPLSLIFGRNSSFAFCCIIVIAF